MLVVPPIYRFELENERMSSWGWMKVADLVEAHNNTRSENIVPAVTAGTLYGEYKHLNREIQKGSTIPLWGISLPAFYVCRNGALSELYADLGFHFKKEEIILTDDMYVPADWGMRLLKAAKNPVQTAILRVLTLGA